MRPTHKQDRSGQSCTLTVEVEAALHPVAALNRHRRFLYPKELALTLEAYGLHGFTERSCRMLVRHMRRDNYPVCLRTQVRAVDAAAWLISHPDWRPFPYTERGGAAARLAAG